MAYRTSGRAGPPAWLVIVLAAMLVFGVYFVWSGIQNYMAGNLQGALLAGATRAAQVTPISGEGESPTPELRFTAAPTRTPVPECQDFVITVPEAIIRKCASTNCAIVGVRHQGDVVCVLERDYTAGEWYIVDLDESRFFTDLNYMHESVMRAVNPTPTPTVTPTAAPVTPTVELPTLALPTITWTPSPAPTVTETPLAGSQ